MALTDGNIHLMARAERLEPAVFRRSLRLRKGQYQPFSHIFLLMDGNCEMVIDDVIMTIRSPSLVFLPPDSDDHVAIAAGAQVLLVGFAPELLTEAIGDAVESPMLRIFTEQPLVQEEALDVKAELLPLLEGFLSEVARPERGSRMVLAAFLRLILMTGWRASGGQETPGAVQSDETSFVQRYRQLVEVNFRRHWPVSDYAEAIGITPDRLHAICQRSLGRPPLQLLHERLLQEAKLRLERSARTSQEISDSLGFRDPTYFSHFFKRKTGLSPAAYRALSRSVTAGDAPVLSANYADWP